MQFFAAYTSLAVTLGLVVARPRVGERLRIGPAPAAAVGVLIMLLAGVVTLGDVRDAVAVLARPLAAIVAMMVTAAVAERIGVLDALAARIFAGAARASAAALFVRVFALSAVTAAALNNDAAVLLLTPAVVALVRRRFPRSPGLVAPFAIAVFMAAGVAPLVLSNPMNMIFAAYAGISFNAYARVMAPIAVAGGIVAALVLRVLFRARLADAAAIAEDAAPPVPLTSAQRRMIALLVGSIGACPLVALAGGEPWIVAVAGAVVAVTLVARAAGLRSPLGVARAGIAWDIVVFLVLVSVLGVGLRNVGLVARLEALYAGRGVAVVGLTSAIGSAVLNNHPMSILNMLALEHAGAPRAALAALVGGDLGPRLLPMGSLAGLLWMEALRRTKVEVSMRTFFLVGAAITVPTLALSLALLSLF